MEGIPILEEYEAEIVAVIESDAIHVIAMQIAIIILVTIVLTKILRTVWKKFAKDTIHQKFIMNSLSAIIGITGIVLALSRLPQFADFAGALLAGSGIAALAIGLAAQEPLSNAFNGLFISLTRPFEVGDRVHLVTANITGFIEDITIRHTVIRSITNSRIIVPNSTINKELIENANFCNPQASAFVDVVVTYESDIALACELMAKIIGEHPDYVDTRPEEEKETTPLVPVLVRKLGLFGVELRASMWTETIAKNFEACSDVRKSIAAEFAEAGIIPAQITQAGYEVGV